MLAWSASLLLAGPSWAQENVLLLILDDVGVDLVGVYSDDEIYGHPGEGADPPLTPNIDAVADGGVLFRDVYSAPVCSATRATILTGQFGFRNGVGNMKEGVNELVRVGIPTLPQVLAPTYRSAAIGKWHLGGGMYGAMDPHNDDAHPVDFAGFEFFAGKDGNFNPSDPSDSAHRGLLENYYQWWKSIVEEGKATRQKWIECDGNNRAHCYVTTVAVNDAIRKMRRFHSQPWFLWVAFNAIHWPWEPAPPPHLVADLDRYDLTSEAGQRMAHMEAMDAEIGRLLAATPPNTTVIVVGDNGSPPFGACKGTLLECGIRVPLIVKRPGMPPGFSESRVLVNTADLFDTIAEIAGAPADAPDSESLVPYLIDPAAAPRDRTSAGGHFAYSELFNRAQEFGKRGERRAIRGLRYKLAWTRDAERGVEEALYDLLADPGETANLLDADADGDPDSLDPPARAALAALRAAMTRLHDSDGDGVDYRFDNCVDVANAATQDCDDDRDGIGNMCDCDFDNDGGCDAADLDHLIESASRRLPPDRDLSRCADAHGCADPSADMNCDGAVEALDFERFAAMGSEPGRSGLWCGDALGSMTPCLAPR